MNEELQAARDHLKQMEHQSWPSDDWSRAESRLKHAIKASMIRQAEAFSVALEQQAQPPAPTAAETAGDYWPARITYDEQVSLFAALKHGSEAHRHWLALAIEAWRFCLPMPPMEA